ncbi:MAG: hypothetical protein DI597_19895 [Pseudoxanthomonas spadix]|nr:MAG: hypothetical protein DI597_19895 [Pseudoxanthomonas spadix]
MTGAGFLTTTAVAGGAGTATTTGAGFRTTTVAAGGAGGGTTTTAACALLMSAKGMATAARTASFEMIFSKYMVGLLCYGIGEMAARGRRA